MPHKRKTQRKRGGPQIVKVQVSIVQTGTEYKQVLVYNKSKSVHLQCDLTKEIAEAMGRDLKAFFYYRIMSDPNRPGEKNVVLDRRAPWQDW